MIGQHHALLRETLAQFPEAEEISTAGDSFFIVFTRPSDAAHFALLAQKATRELAAKCERPISDRIGIHVGEIFISERVEPHRDLFGIQIDTAARVMSLGDGDQILLSRFAFDNARQVLRGQELNGLGELTWLNHGRYEMKGVEEPVEVCEVGESGRAALAPPGDSKKAHRFIASDEEPVLGWRPAVGAVVPATRWVLERALGEGGFGEVWLARHEQLKQQRVFKFCFKADRVRSLKREVTLFRILRERVGEHPGIVAIHDVFFDEPPFYLVMDYVAGPNLAEWSAARPLAEVPLAARLEIVAQIADALPAAHDAGVIHRDVKPSNILLTDDSAEPRAKLTDFGIGQVVSEEALAGVTRLGFTQTMISGSATGTQMYLAPELVAGHPATTRSDIYSLGVVLWQLIRGDLAQPLTSDWAEEITDPLLREDIQKCVAGDPQKRFAGPAALAVNLRALPLRGAAREVEAARLAGLEKRAFRRGILRAAGAALVVVALVGALAAFAFHQARAAHESRARAERSTQAETAAHAKSDEMLTRMQLQHAERLFEEDDAPGGLAYLAAVLRRQPGDRLTAARLVSALRDRSFARPLMKPLEHGSSVFAAEWSPDGKTLISVTKDRIHAWDTTTELSLAPPVAVAHDEDLRGIRFTGDGSRFVAIGQDSQVFETRTLKAITPPLVHPGRLPHRDFADAQFLGDGARIVTVTRSPDVKVWNVETGQPVAELKTDARIEGLALHPDGKRLAVSTDQHELVVWNIESQRIERTLATDGVASSLTFSRDGSRLFYKGFSFVGGFDFEKGERLPWTIDAHEKIAGFDLNPAGQTFAVATLSRTVRFFSADHGEERGSAWPQGSMIGGVRYSANSARLLSRTEQAVRVRDVATGIPVCAGIRPGAGVECASLNRDGTRVAIGDAAGAVTLWEVAASEAHPMLFGLDVFFPPFVLNADESLLAVSDNHGATIWDFKTGRRVGTVDHGETSWCLTFNPAGDQLLTGGTKDQQIRVWDARTGKSARPALPTHAWLGGLFFPRAGDSLFVMESAGGHAQIWDFKKGAQRVPPIGECLTTCALTPDGARAVLIEGKRYVASIFDTSTGQPSAPDAEYSAPVQTLALNASGTMFAAGSIDGRVRVWRIADGQPVTPWMQHRTAVTSMDFSPDDRALATSSSDESVRLWSIPEGREIAEPLVHEQPVFEVKFCPDNQRLATTSHDGSVRLWDRQTGRPISDRLPLYARGRNYRDPVAYYIRWTRDGTRLLGGGAGMALAWDVPAPNTPPPAWLAEWAEAVAAQRLDVQGMLHRIGAAECAVVATKLASISGDDLFSRTARWFYASHAERSISPSSQMGFADYATLVTEIDSDRALAALARMEPHDPRAWGRYVELLFMKATSFNARPPEDLEFLLEQAAPLGPREPSLRRAHALLADERRQPEAALAAARRAVQLDPEDWRSQWLLSEFADKAGEHPAAAEAAEKALATMHRSGYDEVVRERLLNLRKEALSPAGHDVK